MLQIDSEKIRNLMIERKLTVTEIAQKSNLQPTTISHVSRFDKKVTPKTVGKLAAGLGIDPNTIIKQIL